MSTAEADKFYAGQQWWEAEDRARVEAQVRDRREAGDIWRAARETFVPQVLVLVRRSYLAERRRGLSMTDSMQDALWDAANAVRHGGVAVAPGLG